MYFKSEWQITQNSTFFSQNFQHSYCSNFFVKSHENVIVANMEKGKHFRKAFFATYYEVNHSRSRNFTYPNLNSWEIGLKIWKILNS